MKQLQHRIQHDSRSDVFHIYPIGDIHLGSAACNERFLKQTISRIQDDPTAIVILMGDMIDGIGATGFDPRFRLKTIAPWLRTVEDTDDILEEQVDKAVTMLSPIASKIKAILLGNHEDAIERHRGFNAYWSMVDRLATIGGQNPADISLGYDGFVRLRFVRMAAKTSKKNPSWCMNIYAVHGFGGGKKPGSKANAMHDVMGQFEAHLYLMGHTHDLLTVSKTLVIPTDGKMPRVDVRWGVVCGSFMDSYIEPSKKGKPRENYPEYKGMPVLPTGHPIITVKPADQRYTVQMGEAVGVPHFQKQAAK